MDTLTILLASLDQLFLSCTSVMYFRYSGVPGVVDGTLGHGAFGANGGHQAGGRGPGPLPLS